MKLAAANMLLSVLLHTLARALQSEAGKLLSARRMAHLMEAQRYKRLDDWAASQRTAMPLPSSKMDGAYNPRCKRRRQRQAT